MVPFVGGSLNVGEAMGGGAFFGAAKLTCDTGIYGCLGYTASAGHRFSSPSTSFLEVGATGLFYVFPAYAGVGARFRDLKVAGGQVSIGTGLLPLFLVLRAYNESSKISAEGIIGILWALGPVYKNKND